MLSGIVAGPINAPTPTAGYVFDLFEYGNEDSTTSKALGALAVAARDTLTPFG
jgi:hypothetical protein